MNTTSAEVNEFLNEPTRMYPNTRVSPGLHLPPATGGIKP
jgi:hypothetical protein